MPALKNNNEKQSISEKLVYDLIMKYLPKKKVDGELLKASQKKNNKKDHNKLSSDCSRKVDERKDFLMVSHNIAYGQLLGIVHNLFSFWPKLCIIISTFELFNDLFNFHLLQD